MKMKMFSQPLLLFATLKGGAKIFWGLNKQVCDKRYAWYAQTEPQRLGQLSSGHIGAKGYKYKFVC